MFGKTSKRKSAVVALVAAALLATACSSGGGEGTETTGEAAGSTETLATGTSAALRCADPITVGVITDLSGGLSIYGAQLERGVAIGLAYASGGPVQSGDDQSYQVDDCAIRVVFGDDQSNPEVARVVARNLLDQDGASVLIGSVGPSTTATLAELAAANDVLLLAASDTPAGLTESGFGENSFLIALSSAQQAYATCGYFAAALGDRAFVQIAPDYPAGRRAASAFRAACVTAGGEFVADDQLLTAATSDFAAPVAALAAADPDAVLLTWSGGGLGSLISEAASAFPAGTSFGVTFPPDVIMPVFFEDAVGWTSPITYHYTSPNNEVNDYLVDAVADSGSTPDQYDALGMNAALLIVAALRKTGGAVATDVLRSALEGAEATGPKGKMTIRPGDHLAVQNTYIVTLLNIDDPDRNYYRTVATVQPEPPCLLTGEAAPRCG